MKRRPMGRAHQRARALRRDMTEAETKLWRILRSRQIEEHRFRLRCARALHCGFCLSRSPPDRRGQHDSLSQQEADRSRFLQSEGYRVLRVWNDEVLENPEGVH